MTIHYGKFLEANALMLTGGTYYQYFNSVESIYRYKEFLRETGSDDILEEIGEMEFSPKGRLIKKEGTEKTLYNPEGIEEITDDNDDDF